LVKNLYSQPTREEEKKATKKWGPKSKRLHTKGGRWHSGGKMLGITGEIGTQGTLVKRGMREAADKAE